MVNSCKRPRGSVITAIIIPLKQWNQGDRDFWSIDGTDFWFEVIFFEKNTSYMILKKIPTYPLSEPVSTCTSGFHFGTYWGWKYEYKRNSWSFLFLIELKSLKIVLNLVIHLVIYFNHKTLEAKIFITLLLTLTYGVQFRIENIMLLL